MKERNKGQEIKPLTGVRGIAALIVVCYHFAYLDRSGTSKVLPGYLAVDLFFVLSGFVMALSYAHLFRRHPLGSAYGKFLKRRFARIYPVYLLLTLLAFWLGRMRWLGGYYSVPTLMANLTLLQQAGLGLLKPAYGVSILVTAWSISTEVVAYLVFPLLLLLAIFKSKVLAAATALLSVITLIWVSHHPGLNGPLDVSSNYTIYPLIRCIAEFSMGLVTWRMWHRMGAPTRLAPLLDALIVIALLVLIPIHGSDVLIVLVFPVLVIQLCSSRSLLARALGRPFAVWLGEVSYSLYLFHLLSVYVAKGWEPRLAALGVPHYNIMFRSVLLVLDLAIAGALFAFVEKPSRSWLRTWLEGTPPGPILPDPPAP